MSGTNKQQYGPPSKWICPILCAILLLLLMGDTHAQEMTKQFLSATDPGYKALAELQKAACEANPNRLSRCNLAGPKCEEAYGEIVASIKSAMPGVTDDRIKSVISKLCNDRATPYEFPGMHTGLQIRVSNVQHLANERGISIPSNLVFGTLEMNGVNAEVEVETNIGTPLIMVNSPFLEFANEFAKIVVQAMAVTRSGDLLRVDRNPDTVRRRFAEDTIQRKRLSDLIDYFYGKGRDTYQAPDLLSAQIQLAYTDGIETFAIGHEVGHVMHHDPASSLNFSELKEAITKMIRVDKPGTLTRLRELNADCFALSLISQMSSDGLTNGDFNNSIALYAVEFYFISHNILEEAGRAAGYVQHVIPFDPRLTADIPKLVECASRVCDLRNVTGLSEAISGSDEYPPDELRREVVQSMIKSRKNDKVAVKGLREFTDLAEDVNRDAEILWGVIKSDFAANHLHR
jgi:hypothetical protein